ncbi:Glucose-1-phosphate cytidylyltransferase [Rosistilla ulvae]|uniref:Glucose-1-phosphate cytidylyltransferase n=1 Tax=Rosistilla ulvae TaxID=1930277 RepID=A0A517LYQ1_9BACT|nr:glucose-1-phosphate cytidylyltransferase [Rosistilla ulvae]QDS87756.1 Glucose-1-phosphate cytidylyltransferase [Rosistilla ulvae]
MKAVILAGGFGTRLSEETQLKPKPMVEIGGRPILWHLLKLYSHHGINDFVICAGYKAYLIKEYFANYPLHMSDMTWDYRTNTVEVHQNHVEPWRVTVIDTGLETMTGGRLKRIRQHVGDETFLMTYGDGLADIDIQASIRFHRAHGKLATVTATQPSGRFGRLAIGNDTRVSAFQEKPTGDGGWINGGFFVLEPETLDFIEGDLTIWEREPLEQLAMRGELSAYKHSGFWMPMDTLRDKQSLEQKWEELDCPWRVWNKMHCSEDQVIRTLPERVHSQITKQAA